MGAEGGATRSESEIIRIAGGNHTLMNAVNEVDWGRESPGFAGNIGNIETFSLPPALRATSLVRGRLAFLLFLHAGEPLIRGRLAFPLF